MNWFKFWRKPTQETKQSIAANNETYIDIVISLNKNRQIDFSVFLDDKTEKISISPVDYSIMCGEFLYTVLSQKMKTDAVEILNTQIKNSNNHELIDNIVSVISIMDNTKNKLSGSNQFIKPSEVFARYIA